MRETIYLLFGGRSPEHEISIITAKQIFKHVDLDKYNLFPIYLDKEDRFFYIDNFEVFNLFADYKKLHMKPISINISKGKVTFSLNRFKSLPFPKACILSFHGGIGEGGSIQGFLDILDIPYTGPSQVGAVYGMDKIVMKMMFEYGKIPILPWIYLNKNDWEKDSKKEMERIQGFSQYPLIIKPAALGSSIGVKKVQNDEELKDAIEMNYLYGNQVAIEKFGENMRELNCSVRKEGENILTSPIEEVFKTQEGVFSYDEKYVKGGKKAKTNQNEGMAGAKRSIPAKIPKNIEEEVKDLSKKIYELIHGEGHMRIDFLYDDAKQQPYVIEPNTIPGSFSYYLWEAAGLQFHELLDKLIEEAVYRHKTEKKIITSFDSPLLH